MEIATSQTGQKRKKLKERKKQEKLEKIQELKNKLSGRLLFEDSDGLSAPILKPCFHSKATSEYIETS
jgi:uncharacterized membrane protein (DUF106 family)